jgi:hypothetical protein
LAALAGLSGHRTKSVERSVIVAMSAGFERNISSVPMRVLFIPLLTVLAR